MVLNKDNFKELREDLGIFSAFSKNSPIIELEWRERKWTGSGRSYDGDLSGKAGVLTQLAKFAIRGAG